MHPALLYCKELTFDPAFQDGRCANLHPWWDRVDRDGVWSENEESEELQTGCKHWIVQSWCEEETKGGEEKAIKVAVLEGDFATLVGLGFPLSLSIQLQESCLTLRKALWTAKSTNSGFSVSLFWPAPELKDKHQPKRRRRRRAKATKLVPATTSMDDKPSPKPLNPSAKTISLPSVMEAPINATQTSATSPPSKHYSSSPTLHSVSKSDLEKSSDSKDEEKWTKVSCRRRKKAHLPPCWKLRFPVHLQACLQTPSGSSSNTEGSSNGEESDVNETSPHTVTPVAARTRSKLKT